jgi:hypothetical protein
LAWKSTCTSAPSSSSLCTTRLQVMAVCANKPHCQIWSRLVAASTSPSRRFRNRFDPFFTVGRAQFACSVLFPDPRSHEIVSSPPPDGHASTTWVAKACVVASLL